MNTRYLNTLLLAFIAFAGRAGAADAPTFSFLDDECDRDFTVRAVVMVGKSLPANAEARLAFNYQNADNLYFVHVAGGTVGMLKIQDGKATRLNPTAPFKTNADGSLVLTLKRHGARMTLVVNGVIVARAQDAAFSGGRIGTSATGMKFAGVRYQPTEPVFFSDDFTRAFLTGEWETLTGRWHVSSIVSKKFDPQATSNPFSFRATGSELAVTTAGRWFWDNYSFEAAVKADSDGSFGLIVFFQDGNNYVVFRWFSSAANVPPDKAKQLIRVVNGQPQMVDAKPGGYEPGQWYKLTVKANDEKVLAFIDDQPACAMENSFFGEGKVGLYSEFGRTVIFDDVEVTPWDGSDQHRPPLFDEPKVSAEFAKDEKMSAWADPAAAWVRENDNTAWHRGEFFGDAALAVKITDLRAPGSLMLCLHSPTADFHQGYTWKLQLLPQQDDVGNGRRAVPDGRRAVPQAQWELWRQGTMVQQGTQQWDSDLTFLSVVFYRFGQRGRTASDIIGYLAGQRVFAFTDTAPLRGRKVGFFTQGIPLTFRNVQVGGSNLIDETFSNAPTRWWAGRGAWHVEPRWPCDEKWAWFTGGNSETPTLWSKQAFTGDLIVELFAAVQMNSDKDPNGYFHPSDINVTICGDGRDLGSGYNFIFAGWNNRETAILRRSLPVASTYSARMRQPIRTNLDFQHHWYHLLIEKRGTVLRFFVDDKLACYYDDPNPIPSGRIAFWTFKNGLVIARARIYYESPMPAPPFPPTLRLASDGTAQRPFPTASAADDPSASFTPNGIVHDFEGQLHGWTGRGRREGARVSLDSSTASHGKQSLRIQNTTSGGDFAVWASVDGLNIEQYPLLRFDYKLPPQVKVNLYVKINGRYFTIVFTAGEQPDEISPTLGVIKNVIADDQWHTAEINLLTAVRSRFPNAVAPVIEGIAFACPDETYLRCGIGGNIWGSGFNVDNFQILPTTK